MNKLKETTSTSNESFQNKIINLQGEEHIQRKLNRPFGIGDKVILLKDIPENILYRGYLGTISEVFYDSKDIKGQERDNFCEI